MTIDNKIKQLKQTFELRAEIADTMWEVNRLKEIEMSHVNEEEYEKANMVLKQQERLKRLIKNREKKLKKYEEWMT
tara:strand:+ start:144 stop:371 length:228 start_codon:yes stop_codon:yes gene_type:complete